jgi:hypothetical protein
VISGKINESAVDKMDKIFTVTFTVAILLAVSVRNFLYVQEDIDSIVHLISRFYGISIIFLIFLYIALHKFEYSENIAKAVNNGLLVDLFIMGIVLSLTIFIGQYGNPMIIGFLMGFLIALNISIPLTLIWIASNASIVEAVYENINTIIYHFLNKLIIIYVLLFMAICLICFILTNQALFT